MNTEKLIQFFSQKLEKISELKNLNDADNLEFNTWWNTIRSTCIKMGPEYAKRVESISFYPSVLFDGDNSSLYRRSYLSGLSSVEAQIRSIIEELETWGFGDDGNSRNKDINEAGNNREVVLNLTISQHQAQQIAQSINLSQYNEDVQTKVKELLEELRRERKNKNKIIDIVKWLTDKGADALIAILLASTNLT